MGLVRMVARHPLTVDDLTKAPLNIIWRIVDYSGAKRIPEPDKEY